MEEKFAVAVIGAGVAGCCAAAELTRYTEHVLLLEAQNDLACGASRANSGIVHAGFDPKPGTLKAKYNVAGSQMFEQFAARLGIGYKRNQSLVIAFSEDEMGTVQTLYERGLENGVAGMRVIGREELHALEPQVGEEACGALLATTAAICDPYGVTLATAECAVLNGATLCFNAQVVTVERGQWQGQDAWLITCADGRTFAADTVVNAAGVFADEINNQVSAHKLTIKPVRGEYYLLDPLYGSTFERTMFQVPTAAGKGVLVAPTVHGNLFIGPSSVPQESKTSVATSAEGLSSLITAAKRTWKDASARGAITNFAGLRAHGIAGNNADFVIGPVEDVPGFFNIACLESPGLSSVPAIAVDIAQWVADYEGLSLREDYVDTLPAHKHFKLMSEEQRTAAAAVDPAWGHMVCRCCQVCEGEIAEALHGPVPVLSMDALKWRTGATMGRCHGGFCSPELIKVISTQLRVEPTSIDKRLAGSFMVQEAREDYLALASEKPVAHTTTYGVQTDASDTHFDVIVVGAGAAGLAAALQAAKNAPVRVLVVDRAPVPGGIMVQCIHNGFGLHRFHEELTGPEYAAHQVTDIAAFMETRTGDQGSIEYCFDTTVIDYHFGQCGEEGKAPMHEVVVASASHGVRVLTCTALVLATGSRERGLGALNVSGDRPAGIYTAGSAQALMNLQGCLPGKRVVVLGSGDIGLIMARRMTYAGMKVLGAYELMDVPSGLERNIVQCLNDFGIPLHLNATVTRLEGKDRLTAVYVSKVDPATHCVIPHTEERIECDTLVLSVGLIPENDTARLSGMELSRWNGVRVEQDLSTNVPGVFAAGNAVVIHGLADDASKQADVAGLNAARYCKAAQAGTPVNDKAALGYKVIKNPIVPPAPATAPVPSDDPNDVPLTCVNCPLGCRLFVQVLPDGSVSVKNNRCDKGLEWAQKEIVRPTRVLTLALHVSGVLEPLSCRTTCAIPLDLVDQAIHVAREAERTITLPVALGQVLVTDICGTGANLIATKAVR